MAFRVWLWAGVRFVRIAAGARCGEESAGSFADEWYDGLVLGGRAVRPRSGRALGFQVAFV